MDYVDSDDEKLHEEEEVAVEEGTSQDPLMTLSNHKFLLGLPDATFGKDKKAGEMSKMMDLIKEHNMSLYYSEYATALGFDVEETLLKTMQEANEKTLKELEEKIEDAKKNAGDTEVREAKMAKATFFATIGDKEKALAGYNETLEETVGSGGRIDVVFSIIRLGFCVDDADLIAKNLDKVQGFVDAGGDWERRNLLGIYQAAQLIQLRKFKEASVKLLDAIATFTCYQLFDYNTFVFLTVLIALPNLDRVTLRDKVIKAPEILSVIRDIPNLHELLFSLYKCDYSSFFKALSLISEQIKCDRFMAKHLGYYLREIRIVAYDQFLTSYKSVTVESMASAFGVSIGFLDKELSRFIAAGRINCKIDKVEGVVETIRPDAKNMQYAATLKEGDALLNRIQKLTKVISA